jgi:hypothetical protein
MADQVIEIRDPEINTEEIMARIRQRIRERRALAEGRGLDYDRLVADDFKSPDGGRLSGDVYYDLHQLRGSADNIWVTLSMRDRHFPLLNPILYRIEKLLHRLALKYVNLLAGRQVVVNRAATHLLSETVRAVDDMTSRVETLEKQVVELRERLAKIEQLRKSSS